MSAQYCGCDPEAKHTCTQHIPDRWLPGPPNSTHNTTPINLTHPCPGAVIQWNGLGDPPEIPKSFVVKDSGLRQQFASGSLRDTTTGKLNWSRVVAGPMLRRWAQHLTTAEAKYPDVAPGVANWTLIESDEEYYRYKESAFRHFMSWFNGECDEDHAAAVFFNINGVCLIEEKNAAKKS